MSPASSPVRTLNPHHFPALVPPHGQGRAPGIDDPKANRLLGALSESAYQGWLHQLEAVDMPLGMVLYEPGRPLKHAYFPTTSVVALMYELEDGHSGAVSVVGNEGIVGVSMLMGGSTTLGRTVVLIAGRGFRLRAAALMVDFELGGPVTRLLLRYTQALMCQLAQVVVCNRHHALDRRLCCFLLTTLDRLAGGSDFVMTQELIADALGVRRESVTEAALKLQRAGLMRYERGHITVLDRAGLAARCCECYAVVKKEYERLLPAGSVQ